MGMWTMRTPSCDAEAEERAEAKAEHLASLNPRDRRTNNECDEPWSRMCPECGREDNDLMNTTSRHVAGCEHAALMLAFTEDGEE